MNNPPNILIVESHPVWQRWLSEYAKKTNLAPLVCENEVEALLLLKKTKVDLLLYDLVPSSTRTSTFLRLVKKHYPQTQVLLMTSDKSTYREWMEKVRPHELLLKPFEHFRFRTAAVHALKVRPAPAALQA